MCAFLEGFNLIKDLVVPLSSAGVGGFIAYYAAMRSIREQFRLQRQDEIENAIDGIWIELDQNIKSLEDDPSWAHFAHLSDSAWNKSKPLIGELGPDVVGPLTTAYALSGRANNAISVFISRSPAQSEAKNAVGGLAPILLAARGALEQARPDLVKRLMKPAKPV
jgi:hypothetical protein